MTISKDTINLTAIMESNSNGQGMNDTLPQKNKEEGKEHNKNELKYFDMNSSSDAANNIHHEKSDFENSAKDVTTQEEQQRYGTNFNLVRINDKEHAPESLHFLCQQMEICKLSLEDEGKYRKKFEVGFPGIACKWCLGTIGGRGQFFTSSYASFTHLNFVQSIEMHINKCYFCPDAIREELKSLKEKENVKKPKFGVRQRFMTTLWCRIHDLDLDEFNIKRKEESRKKREAAKIKRLELGVCTGNEEKPNKVASFMSDNVNTDRKMQIGTEDIRDEEGAQDMNGKILECEDNELVGKKKNGIYVYDDSIEIHHKFDKYKNMLFVQLQYGDTEVDTSTNNAGTPTEPPQKKQKTSHRDHHDTTNDVETQHNRAMISTIEVEMFGKETSSKMSIFEKVKKIEFYLGIVVADDNVSSFMVEDRINMINKVKNVRAKRIEKLEEMIYGRKEKNSNLTLNERMSKLEWYVELI